MLQRMCILLLLRTWGTSKSETLNFIFCWQFLCHKSQHQTPMRADVGLGSFGICVFVSLPGECSDCPFLRDRLFFKFTHRRPDFLGFLLLCRRERDRESEPVSSSLARPLGCPLMHRLNHLTPVSVIEALSKLTLF